MQRYFCFDKETLKEAMNTRVKVNGLSDIINLLTSPSYLPNLTNIHIDNDPIEDERCLEYEGWGNITYDVLADLEKNYYLTSRQESFKMNQDKVKLARKQYRNQGEYIEDILK